MAWQDAEREIARRRRWWHRRYRLPLYLEILSDAFAAGHLPRMSMADDGGEIRTPRMARAEAATAATREGNAQSLALSRPTRESLPPQMRATNWKDLDP